MPRCAARCPNKQDAQTNKMPRQTRCAERCPTKQDAQMRSEMPKQDAQINKMPRCPTRCPDKQDAQMPNIALFNIIQNASIHQETGLVNV